MHALSFIWHQFLADTKRHTWFIVGYGGIVALLAWMNAALSFEYTFDDHGVPRMEYQNMVLLITLLPASFMVPFLVFADPVDAPDAFWRVKPIGGMCMAGAKVLWIMVWLIGMPLLGECISVIALGGVSKLSYIVIDFIGMRGMVLFLVFGLATLTNQPFKFLVGLIALFFCFVITGSLVSSMMDRPRMANRAEVAMYYVLFWVVILGSLLVAMVQYRWRRTVGIGLPLVVCLFLGAFTLKQQTIDFSPTPQEPIDSRFKQLRMDLSDVSIEPGKRTFEGNDPDLLKMRFTVDSIPPLATVGFGEMDLKVDTGHGIHTFSHLPSYAFPQWRQRRLDEMQNENDRQQEMRIAVYQNILLHLRGEELENDLPLINEFGIPIQGEPGIKSPAAWKITGVVRYHCYSFSEFGRFPIDTEEVVTNISMNKETRLDFYKQEVFFRWIWKSGYARYPGIRVYSREITGWTDPMNLDAMTFGSPIASHWFFYLHDTNKNEFWENQNHVNGLYPNGMPWSTLYFGWTTMKGPEDFTYNEWIAFRAHFVGRVEFPFETEIVNTP